MSILILLLLVIVILYFVICTYVSHYFLKNGFPKLKFKSFFAAFFATLMTILVIYALYLY